ncbi:MAG: EamA family transporter [Bacillati bacterium ANGP1]|uniref:EamA family transporter n=1 Tax=Candidatus Segetimicrobium genomatis TaxID=2569760 RepID=A0A537KXR1_9BACT|nr:MAG: EamA family transporter [Terrabacteria group bacterium ANGP1]
MTATLHSRLRGYAAVMAAATLWGVSGVVAKVLFNRRIEPWTLVEIRLTASFLTLLVILTLRGHPLRVPRDLLGRLVLLGLAMTSAQFTYYLTISLTGVSTALFLQYTAPVFVALYAWAAKGEAITPLRGGAILLAVTGSYFLVTGGEGIRIHPLGLLSGCLSAVAFGVYAILGRGRIQQVGSWTMLLYALGSGAAAWSLIVPPWKAYLPAHAPVEWALFGFIVVFATILPFGLFLYGLRHITSSLASLTATLEPVVGSTAAMLMLHEVLGAVQITGGLAIVAAVVLIQVSDLFAARRVVLPSALD